MRLTCPSGQLDPHAVSHDGESIFRVGIVDASQKLNDACSKEVFSEPFNCTQFLDTEKIHDSMRQVAGRQSVDYEHLNLEQY